MEAGPVPADAGHPVEFLPEGEDVFQCDPAGFQRNVTDGKGRAAVFRPGTFLWEYIPGRRISRDRKTLAPWRQFRVHAAAFIYAWRTGSLSRNEGLIRSFFRFTHPAGFKLRFPTCRFVRFPGLHSLILPMNAAFRPIGFSPFLETGVRRGKFPCRGREAGYRPEGWRSLKPAGRRNPQAGASPSACSPARTLCTCPGCRQKKAHLSRAPLPPYCLTACGRRYLPASGI